VGFIVTTLTGTNRAVVRFYNQRGTAEQWIKEGKAATHWTRLSCHRFRVNEVRLLLGVTRLQPRQSAPSAGLADRHSAAIIDIK
jgi:hypothetical protein